MEMRELESKLSKLRDPKRNYESYDKYHEDIAAIEEAILGYRERMNDVSFKMLDNKLSDDATRQLREQYFASSSAFEYIQKKIIDYKIVISGDVKEQLRVLDESLAIKNELNKRSEQDSLVKAVERYIYNHHINFEKKKQEEALIEKYYRWYQIKYGDAKERKLKDKTIESDVRADAYRFSIKQNYIYDFEDDILREMREYLSEVYERKEKYFYDDKLRDEIDKWLIGNTENKGLVSSDKDLESLKSTERDLALYMNGDVLDFEKAHQNPTQASSVCSKGNRQIEHILNLAFAKNIKIESFNMGYRSQNDIQTMPMITFAINEHTDSYINELISALHKKEGVEIIISASDKGKSLTIRFNPFDKANFWAMIEGILSQAPEHDQTPLPSIFISLFEIINSYDSMMGDIRAHYYQENGLIQVFTEVGNSYNGLSDIAINYVKDVKAKLKALCIPNNGLDLLNIKDDNIFVDQLVSKLTSFRVFLVKEEQKIISHSLIKKHSLASNTDGFDANQLQHIKQSSIDMALLETLEKSDIETTRRRILDIVIDNDFSHFINDTIICEAFKKSDIQKLDFIYSIFKTLITYQMMINNVGLNKSKADIDFESLLNNNGLSKCIGILMSEPEKFKDIIDHYLKIRYIDNCYKIIDNTTLKPSDNDRYPAYTNALYELDKYMGYINESEITQSKVI